MVCQWFKNLTIFAALLCFTTTCSRANNISAIFIFGDSIADVGNNNYIASLSKANFEPVGIDFGMPTGRFTNGRTVFDIIGQSLGFKIFIPPYLAPTTVGPVILQGVNYASGAGGILNETGANYVGRISMDAQLHNFGMTRNDILSSIGKSAADKLLATALFAVTMGANDFINNYFLPDASNHTKKTSPEKFIGTLISTFRWQLLRLYNMGARKIIVTSIPPIGCCPNQKDLHPSSGQECVAFENRLVQQYNNRLKRLLLELTATLKGSTFVYVDVYRIFESIIQNYTLYGFETKDFACCGKLGLHHGIVPCLPNAKVCPDRSKYVFWDPYHATETTNIIIAKRVMDGDSDDISPINVRTLSQI
uniref:GDSL esterase/lipase At4g16230-like n=1 Tax=Erigeron canadensis TaxID=72917 RepID=UPI001CB8FC68|nr:GDSL esterase/lipase At4g16230-like [Erigeron canadensis]